MSTYHLHSIAQPVDKESLCLGYMDMPLYCVVYSLSRSWNPAWKEPENMRQYPSHWAFKVRLFAEIHSLMLARYLLPKLPYRTSAMRKLMQVLIGKVGSLQPGSGWPVRCPSFCSMRFPVDACTSVQVPIAGRWLEKLVYRKR